MTTKANGKLIGVGVGPGDPELMTLKAWRLISKAKVLSFLVNDEGHSQAKQIAVDAINEKALVIPLLMPMLKDRTLANQAYDEGALAIKAKLEAGEDVMFLCEGDPLFFGSFAYLLERLEADFCCEVVPGISSPHAAAAAMPRPLTRQKDSYAVISGRHTDEQLKAALLNHDSVVIIKAGQSRQRIVKALHETNRGQDASYLEYIGRDNEFIEHDITRLADTKGPYFSLFVVAKR